MSTSKLLEHAPSPLHVTVLCLIGSYLALAIWAPYTHNPDADFYFGVALRISRGEFLKSVDGMYSPLLSWLMGLLIWAGISIPDSFRFVNLIAFTVYISGAIAISRRLMVSNFAISFVLILTSVLAIPYTIFIVTSDLIAGAIFIWILYLFLSSYSDSMKSQLIVGALAGLAYLAKNIFFVIFPVLLLSTIIYPSLFQFSSRRYALRAAICASIPFFLICLPWILLISRKYGALVISAQQLPFYGPILSRDYHPDLPAPLFLAGMRPNPLVRADYSIWMCIKNAIGSLTQMFLLAYQYLSSQLRIIHLGAFSSIAFIFIGAYCIFRKTLHGAPYWKATIILILAYVFTYLAIWGGHFRYYIPILPLLILVVVEGLTLFRQAFAASSRLFVSHSIAALIGLSAFEIGCANFNYVKLLWYSVDQEILHSLARRPELSSKSCPLTGNVHDEYSGLVAALLKREKWNSLYPRIDTDTEQVRQKLNLWGSCQILWTGELMPALSHANFIHSIFRLEESGIKIEVFDIERTD